MYSIELRQKRKKLAEDNRALLDKAREESRDLTPEETQQWDTRDADVVKLTAEIERYERQEALDKDLNTVEQRSIPPGNEGPSVETPEDNQEATNRAFSNYLRYGADGMSPEERALLKALRTPVDATEQRALTSVTGSSGAHTIPPQWRREVQAALLAFGGMRQASFILTTDSGAALSIPTSDDTSNSGALLAENTAASEQDIAFALITLNAYKYTSKMIKVPIELLQDSAIDVDAFIRSRFVERLGRITNAQYTTGTGSSQPNGVVTASTAGKTAASATALTYLELLDLKHSVDPAYRFNARWMFKDSTLLAIKKLVDSTGRPLWSPGVSVGEPDRIDGDPYTINQDMAAIATGNKTVLYGDFSKYWIRDVSGMRVVRMNERFADADQVGFVAFMRTDADLLDAGVAPIKHLVQA